MSYAVYYRSGPALPYVLRRIVSTVTAANRVASEMDGRQVRIVPCMELGK